MNLFCFLLQPGNASSLRRHAAASFVKNCKLNERKTRAVEPASPASYSSSMEVSMLLTFNWVLLEVMIEILPFFNTMHDEEHYAIMSLMSLNSWHAAFIL